VPLEGGSVNHVTLVNGHVRRPAPARAAFVHLLLRLFEQAGWTGAPRLIGITSDGREMLSYIDGCVVWETERLKEAQVVQSLAGVARLVRQFHDLTAGDALAGASEVVCHNDLSPKNTVCRCVTMLPPTTYSGTALRSGRSVGRPRSGFNSATATGISTFSAVTTWFGWILSIGNLSPSACSRLLNAG
jgi:hypothetical protein